MPYKKRPIKASSANCRFPVRHLRQTDACNSAVMEAALDLRTQIQALEAEIGVLTSRLAVSREEAARAAEAAERQERDNLPSLLAEIVPLRAINTYTKQLAEAKEQLQQSKTALTKHGYGEGNEGLLRYYDANFAGQPLPGGTPPKSASHNDWRRGCWHILTHAKNSRSTALVFIHFYLGPFLGLLLLLFHLTQTFMAVYWSNDPDEQYITTPESMRLWSVLVVGGWYAWLVEKEQVLYNIEKDCQVKVFSDAFNAMSVAVGQALAAGGGAETEWKVVDWLGWRGVLVGPGRPPSKVLGKVLEKEMQPAEGQVDPGHDDSQFAVVQIPTDYTSPFITAPHSSFIKPQQGVKNRLTTLHSSRSDRVAAGNYAQGTGS